MALYRIRSLTNRKLTINFPRSRYTHAVVFLSFFYICAPAAISLLTGSNRRGTTAPFASASGRERARGLSESLFRAK